MTDMIRRVVTTHNPAGKAVLLSDNRIPLFAFPGGKAKGAAVWSTGAVPADNIGDTEGSKRAAGVFLKGGSVLRVTEFAPGFVSPMHRTLSIDYAVILSGRLQLVLDGGETIMLKTGDTIIQRGTNHAWLNLSRDRPCRIMVAMVEAHPVTVAGKRLRQTPTWRMIASVLAGMLEPPSRSRSSLGTTRDEIPSQGEGVRRIVTGHNLSGKAVVLSEQEVDSLPSPGLETTETALWRTDRVPADNTRNDESAPSIVGSAMLTGSAFRIIELAPGCTTPAHRGPSIDYCVLLSGETELILDNGKCIMMSAGDIAILRGTRQAWRNPSMDMRCRIAVCMIEAQRISVAGKTLGAMD